MDIVDRVKKHFVINTSLIVILGIVMVYSSSYIYAKETFGSSTHFFLKQIIFTLIGVSIAFLISRTKMTFWFKYIYYINSIAVTMLFLTMTPLGVTIKGSQRWIHIANFNFQPGEFIKYTVCLSAIYYFNKFKDYSPKVRSLLSLHFLIPLLLLVIQPDFGTFSITAALIAFACFLSDFPRKYFYSAFVLGLVSAIGILFAAPYRVKRLMVFLDPWSDPQNSGFQIIQSYLAFANGHIFGQGIGNSNEKLFYLPEAYNDFILSVIGEEVGFMGVIVVVGLFMSFTFLGLKLSLIPQSKINKQIIACLVCSISIQAFINMSVVLGLLPTKGLNLPFISYGGSSLISNIIAVGVVLSCLKFKSQIYDGTPVESSFSQTSLGF